MTCTQLRRLTGVALLVASVSFAAATSTGTQSTKPPAKAKTAHHSAHHRKTTHKTKVRGQKAIDEDRVRQIQQALIHEHYLNGDASGTWDASTQQAMKRYQADQGWQSKTVPDSRALIRLGLGPDNQHLLNPESAMTNGPGKQHSSSATTTAASSTQAAGGAQIPAASSEVSVPSSGVAATPAR